MKPIISIVVWFSQLFLLCIVYSMLCVLMPDIYLYDVYTDKFGFITEEQWYDRYTFSLLVLSLLLTTFLIWLIARYRHIRKNR